MRGLSLAVVGLFFLGSAASGAPPVTTMTIECNWGKLTMEQIQKGFDQGGHASDPSGDGHGPGTADEPRVGLANVVEQGNLQTLCQFLEDLIAGN
jgi:hypothetical protein